MSQINQITETGELQTEAVLAIAASFQEAQGLDGDLKGSIREESR